MVGNLLTNKHICFLPLQRVQHLMLGPECTICCEALGTGLCATPCGHVFHMECMQRWVVQKACCPLCKMHTSPVSLVPLQYTLDGKQTSGLQTSHVVGVQQRLADTRERLERDVEQMSREHVMNQRQIEMCDVRLVEIKEDMSRVASTLEATLLHSLDVKESNRAQETELLSKLHQMKEDTQKLRDRNAYFLKFDSEDTREKYKVDLKSLNVSELMGYMEFLKFTEAHVTKALSAVEIDIEKLQLTVRRLKRKHRIRGTHGSIENSAAQTNHNKCRAKPPPLAPYNLLRPSSSLGPQPMKTHTKSLIQRPAALLGNISQPKLPKKRSKFMDLASTFRKS